jgi:hypothetical protein
LKKREVDEVKARVKQLEGKDELSQREEKELEQKRSIYDRLLEEKNLLLANLSELRKEKARLEVQQRAGQGFLLLCACFFVLRSICLQVSVFLFFCFF